MRFINERENPKNNRQLCIPSGIEGEGSGQFFSYRITQNELGGVAGGGVAGWERAIDNA